MYRKYYHSNFNKVDKYLNFSFWFYSLEVFILAEDVHSIYSELTGLHLCLIARTITVILLGIKRMLSLTVLLFVLIICLALFNHVEKNL